jgi:hypothetical protein
MCSTPPASQAAGAHPVDGVAGDATGEPGEDSGSAADREALVADLRCRCDRHVVDALRRHVRIPAEQFADGGDHKIICPGSGIAPGRPRSPEGRAYRVDENDRATETSHFLLQSHSGDATVIPRSRRGWDSRCYSPVTPGSTGS